MVQKKAYGFIYNKILKNPHVVTFKARMYQEKSDI